MSGETFKALYRDSLVTGQDVADTLMGVLGRLDALESLPRITDITHVDMSKPAPVSAAPETKEQRIDRICGDCGNRGCAGYVGPDNDLCRACPSLDEPPAPLEHDDCRVECHPDCPHNSGGRCSYDGGYHGKTEPASVPEPEMPGFTRDESNVYAPGLYVQGSNDPHGPFAALATLAQVEAEFVRLGGKVQTETPRQKVAEALLDMTAMHGDYYSDAALRFRVAIKMIEGKESLINAQIITRWLERQAATLEDDPTAPPIPPCRGSYGEEFGF